jgi:GDPmannose 4,6-dehydratase
VVRIDPRYFRPTEVESLLGDASRAREQLGWEPVITLQQLCSEMIACDLKDAQRHALLKQHGFELPVTVEN